MPRSKKGRLSGGARKELNERRAANAVNGKADGIAFGRVTKMLGAGHVTVSLNSKHGPKDLIARIPNVLGRKGATPITTRDVVTIYVGTEFNVDEPIKATDMFEITAVLSQKQAYNLKQDGIIPTWMMSEDGEKAADKEDEAGGFEFDYDEAKEGEEETDRPGFSRKAARDAVDAKSSSDEDDLNIDDI